VGAYPRASWFSGEDTPVSDLFSEPGAVRIYLFTKYELVTIRAAS